MSRDLRTEVYYQESNHSCFNDNLTDWSKSPVSEKNPILLFFYTAYQIECFLLITSLDIDRSLDSNLFKKNMAFTLAIQTHTKQPLLGTDTLLLPVLRHLAKLL